MERLACVNVAAFPLQLLLRTHPEWRARPVAVVADDRPQALVLHANARARRAGVHTGQRYQPYRHALSSVCTYAGFSGRRRAIFPVASNSAATIAEGAIAFADSEP